MSEAEAPDGARDDEVPERLVPLIASAAFVVLVLAVGIGIFVALVKTKPEPATKERIDRGALVEVGSVAPATHRLHVSVQGTVVPARQVVAQPELSGRIVQQHPELVPGGRFKKGETLIRIDPRDYALALRQQQASVDRARLELELEQSRREIAKQEWKIIGEDHLATPQGKALALRKPQLRTAETSLRSAKSGRATARLALGRTALTVPFNAMVTAEAVDIGQLVTPATPLATLVGTDEFWVRVVVPVDKLGTIDVPGIGGVDEGSKATIWQEINGERVERSGRVIRLLGDLDPVGRMARVLVQIEDPLGLEAPKESATGEGEETQPRRRRLPMLLGSYVHVDIEGRTMADVTELPRRALREGNRVFLFDEGKLVVKEVDVVWRRKSSVLVRGGISPADRIITSLLPTPVAGMKLRVNEDADEKSVVGKR